MRNAILVISEIATLAGLYGYLDHKYSITMVDRLLIAAVVVFWVVAAGLKE